jgi:hypothetical protein
MEMKTRRVQEARGGRRCQRPASQGDVELVEPEPKDLVWYHPRLIRGVCRETAVRCCMQDKWGERLNDFRLCLLLLLLDLKVSFQDHSRRSPLTLTI